MVRSAGYASPRTWWCSSCRLHCTLGCVPDFRGAPSETLNPQSSTCRLRCCYDEMFLHSIQPAQTLTMTATASTSSGSESEDDYSTDHVVVLYASETGNAEDTAERVGREFRRLGRRCVIMSMDMFDVVSGISSG